jgi:hypothetical protein
MLYYTVYFTVYLHNTYIGINSFIRLLVYSFMHSFIYLFINQMIYSFICFFLILYFFIIIIILFNCLFIYLFVFYFFLSFFIYLWMCGEGWFWFMFVFELMTRDGGRNVSNTKVRLCNLHGSTLAMTGNRSNVSGNQHCNIVKYKPIEWVN